MWGTIGGIIMFLIIILDGGYSHKEINRFEQIDVIAGKLDTFNKDFDKWVHDPNGEEAIKTLRKDYYVLGDSLKKL